MNGNKAIALLVIFLLFCLSSLVGKANPSSLSRPKVGLVLSGGGARGMAHVGVLRALEDLNIPVDAVVGTSMGAVVGGLYASGLSVNDIEEWLLQTDWQDLFDDRPSRQDSFYANKAVEKDFLLGLQFGLKEGRVRIPSNLLSGQKLIFELRKMTFDFNQDILFDDLLIPFRAVATDLELGERVVLDHGNLADCIRASMAFPGLVAPLAIEGKLLGDGFMTSNLPVDVVKEMGVDVVIAVDVGEELQSQEEIETFWGMTSQVIRILAKQNNRLQLKLLSESDVLIDLDLAEVSTTNFSRVAETIEAGFQAAYQQKESLLRYQVAASDFVEFRDGQLKDNQERVIAVDAVRIDNQSRIPEETIAERLTFSPEDKEVNLQDLQESLSAVYQLGNLSLVDYKLDTDDGLKTLTINAVGDELGPNYLRFGFNFASDLSGESEFTIRSEFERTELNDRGSSALFQFQMGEDAFLGMVWNEPLNATRTYSIKPSVFYTSDQVQGRDAEDLVVFSDREEINVGLYVNRDFGNSATVQFGPFWRAGSYDFGGDLTAIGAQFFFDYDQLDNLNFPKKGFKANFSFESSFEELDANASYQRWESTLWYPVQLKGESFLFSVRAGGKFADDLPELSRFELGGFANLSGFAKDSLYDQYYGRALLAYYQKVGDRSPSRVLGDVYAGFTLETGGIWSSTEDIDIHSAIWAGSIFVGVETPLGPLFLAVGHAERNERSLYLYLGSPW